MNQKKKSSDFLVQGSILAIASIVSRIIGLVYRIPMTAIIGDLGNNYYGAAYEVYNIMLLISSYSIPLAVSKVVSEYSNKREMKTVSRVLKCALMLAFASSMAGFLIIWFGAAFLTEGYLKTPLSIYALKVLAPTLVIFSILGVFRGFFQGLGTMMPTAVSQIIEQLVNAFVSVFAAYLLFQYGGKIGGVLGNSEEYSAAYGAAGGTLGTTMGAIAGLLFILFLFLVFRPSLKTRVRKDRNVAPMEYGSILRILIFTIVPVLLSTTIYNVSSFLDQGIFKHIAIWQNYSNHTIDIWWGVFSGKYKLLINVPISIASAMVASTVPELTAAFSYGDMKAVRRSTNRAIHFVMIIAMPCAVGLGVLASPIMQLLFHDSSKMAEQFMQVGCVSVIFYSLSTLTNGILQGINRLGEPVKNAVIALILHLILMVALLYGLRLNIYAVIIATIAYPLLVSYLNSRSIRKYMRYRQEFLRTFFISGISALIMGVVVYFAYYGMMLLLKNNAVSTIISILVGGGIYFISLILLRGIREDELAAFPKGTALIKIAKKLHIL